MLSHSFLGRHPWTALLRHQHSNQESQPHHVSQRCIFKWHQPLFIELVRHRLPPLWDGELCLSWSGRWLSDDIDHLCAWILVCHNQICLSRQNGIKLQSISCILLIRCYYILQILCFSQGWSLFTKAWGRSMTDILNNRVLCQAIVQLGDYISHHLTILCISSYWILLAPCKIICARTPDCSHAIVCRQHIVPKAVILRSSFPLSPGILTYPTMLPGQWLQLRMSSNNTL